MVVDAGPALPFSILRQIDGESRQGAGFSQQRCTGANLKLTRTLLMLKEGKALSYGCLECRSLIGSHAVVHNPADLHTPSMDGKDLSEPKSEASPLSN